MATSAIIRFTTGAGKAEALIEVLKGVQDGVIAAGGRSITLCQSETDPNTILEYEIWESSDDHKAFLASLPKSAMDGIIALLAGPIEVTYARQIKTTTK